MSDVRFNTGGDLSRSEAFFKQLDERPIGDRLDFWSEGGNYLMPNSRQSLPFADRFHSYSPEEHPDRDLSVTTVAPDLLTPLGAAGYSA